MLPPRWRPLMNAVEQMPSSNADHIGERKTWTQSEFYTWQEAPKMYMVYQRKRWPNIVQSFVDLR